MCNFYILDALRNILDTQPAMPLLYTYFLNKNILITKKKGLECISYEELMNETGISEVTLDILKLRMTFYETTKSEQLLGDNYKYSTILATVGEM
jgi:DNA-binding Xre family transcriptional regulator